MPRNSTGPRDPRQREVCPLCGKIKLPPLYSRRTGVIGKNWPSRKARNSAYCWHYPGPATKRALRRLLVKPRKGPTQRKDRRAPSKPR